MEGPTQVKYGDGPEAGSPPPSSTVRVWRVDLDRPPPETSRLGRVLSDDERERAARYRSRADARRFLVCRAALRDVLARHLDSTPDRLAFQYTGAGKPELARPSPAAPVFFNVSHSGDVALIALGDVGPIGVDVEQIRPVEDWRSLAERFFAEEEVSALARLPEDQRLDGFFACWTRKEAYLKAMGTGVTAPLDGFAVSVGPADPPRLLHIAGDSGPARAWRLADVTPGAGTIATLAVRAIRWQLESHHWSPVGIH